MLRRGGRWQRRDLRARAAHRQLEGCIRVGVALRLTTTERCNRSPPGGAHSLKVGTEGLVSADVTR